MILESIYEGYFEDTSHGFRPNRSCHTALSCVQRYYTGCKWFIEGDIEAFFDKINHDTLISILSERIKDERFLRLIRKFLNAGYIEDWKFYKTYSGTPQGGIISPILANIYLDKLDKYIKSYTKYFEKGMVVFFAGGTGHPYFSTDTATVLRAIEIEADVILLAKAIDGVYDSDPKTNPDAKRYDEVSIQEVIDKQLAVVDLTASILSMENKMPMYVFGLNEENSIVKAISGDFNGTKVTV